MDGNYIALEDIEGLRLSCTDPQHPRVNKFTLGELFGPEFEGKVLKVCSQYDGDAQIRLPKEQRERICTFASTLAELSLILKQCGLEFPLKIELIC
jgi:hypothetical protein